MNIGEKLEKLMEFIYDKYESDSSFKEFGEFVTTLIEESGIDFGDNVGAQVDAIRLLLEKGWVEIVALNRTRITTTRVTVLSRIKPTPAGIAHVEEGRKSCLKRHWPRFVTAVTEGVVRAFKKE